MADPKETAFNYLSDEKYGTLFTSEKKIINKIHKWIEKGEDVEIKHINSDGSIVCKVPKEWLSVRPKIKRKLTEEQRKAIVDRLKGGIQYDK